jgi:hypothetical protein
MNCQIKQQYLSRASLSNLVLYLRVMPVAYPWWQQETTTLAYFAILSETKCHIKLVYLSLASLL